MDDAIVPHRWNETDVWVREAQVPPAKPLDAVVAERGPDRVLFGPRGEVLARIEDRPFLGFHGGRR